jgi:Uma2 family endonuclease
MMVAMTAAPEEMPRETLESVLRRIGDRPLTVEDLAELPDDSLRYEIDEGVLIVNAAPSDFHQLAAVNLAVILKLACPRGFAVLGAPAAVISPVQVRIPDIVVVPSQRFNPEYSDIPPVLAVEVASPSTRAYDRTRKLQVYAEFGIADYWIVGPDPEKPSITAFALDGKRYRQARFAAGGETFTAARPFPVSFTPLDLVDTGA